MPKNTLRGMNEDGPALRDATGLTGRLQAHQRIAETPAAHPEPVAERCAADRPRVGQSIEHGSIEVD